MKRSRGRGRRQQNPVNRSYDSNGPDVRVRGTASQVYEKYQALARDAMSAGDRVMAENYSQHGEHYYRIMLSLQPPPSEADKEGAADSDANGDAVEAGEGDSGSEPLVLVRDADEGDDKPAKPSANPSRRRGPLRKKKADKADAENGAENGAETVSETASETDAAQAEIIEPQMSVVEDAPSEPEAQSAD